MNQAKDIDTIAADIEALYRQAGLLESGIFSTAAHWRELLSHPHNGRLGLVGLYKSRLPIDTKTVTEETIFNLSDDSKYQTISADLQARYGVKHVYFGIYMCVWVGLDDVAWDFFSISEFPNRASMVDFMSDPGWISVCQARVKVLAKHRNYAVRLPDSGLHLS